MSLDTFWQHYADCARELAEATTVDDVVDTCNRHFDKSSGDAFFPGGSGDEEVLSILVDSGWSPVWVEAHYYFGIRQPDGKDALHYVEGDVYRGVGRPL